MKSLKLNEISTQILDEKEMEQLNGGNCDRLCGCSCWAANSGGSSIDSNSRANYGVKGDGPGGGSFSSQGNTAAITSNCGSNGSLQTIRWCCSSIG